MKKQQDKKTAKFLIAMTDNERAEFSAVAGALGLTLSAFIRDTLIARCAHYRRIREKATAEALGTAPGARETAAAAPERPAHE